MTIHTRNFLGLLLTSIAFSAAVAQAESTGSIFQMRLVVAGPADNADRMVEVIHNRDVSMTNMLYVEKAVLLDQTALKSAKASTDKLGYARIDITFTEAGTKQFAEITRQNLNKQLAIIVDGQVREAPRIASEISGGKAVITGSFSKEEAQDLAKRLNAAAKKK